MPPPVQPVPPVDCKCAHCKELQTIRSLYSIKVTNFRYKILEYKIKMMKLKSSRTQNLSEHKSMEREISTLETQLKTLPYLGRYDDDYDEPQSPCG